MQEISKIIEKESEARQKAESELAVIQQMALQYGNLMSYSMSQAQLINMMYKRLVNVGVFFQEMFNTVDLSDEDEETIEQLIEKYKLDEVIPQEDNMAHWQ